MNDQSITEALEGFEKSANDSSAELNRTFNKGMEACRILVRRAIEEGAAFRKLESEVGKREFRRQTLALGGNLKLTDRCKKLASLQLDLSKDADVIRAMKIFGTDAARKGAEFFNRRGGKK